ncbi:MAG: hypothetical protein KC503_26800, partial [Myxococcales bacterium]|nr:hypothetical protein [Myxococcales bacterium]
MAEAREHPLDVEALQERLTTARRQVALEREQRAHAEHLARGLVELSTVSTPEQLAELLVKITKNILDCDAVIVSGPHGGPLQAREHTHAALSSLSWARDEFVERVLGGRPVIVARADRHPLWRAEPASVRDVVGSALHARVFDDADEGSVMLVAVHGERGYFGREHARRIELIRASLEQAWRRGLAVEREARLRHQAEVANERLRLAQSELLAARDSAERASHAKSAFLAQMSHELRTPLAGIIGLTQLALDGDDLGDEPRSLIGTARECAQHLLQVLNDILDLSKVEAGRLELEAIPLDVSELARQVIELVRVRADEKGLALDLDLELEPAACRRIGDPLRLKQVLFNLLSNGIKFTERGRVALRVQAGEGSTLRFEVRDTGIGVAPEKLTTIFEAFHQADNSTTRRFGGSGLGLAICRQLVKRFGGEIGATSELGVGSCFVFTVPLALATQREPAGRAATVGRAATGRAV